MVAEQETPCAPREAAAAQGPCEALRPLCHVAHWFRRSKKPGFSCEMAPTKPIRGPGQSKGRRWGSLCCRCLSAPGFRGKRGCHMLFL